MTSVASIFVVSAGFWLFFHLHPSQADALFNHRLSCALLQTQLDNEAHEFNAAQQPIHQCTASDPCGDYFVREAVDEIFYSPRLNTCVDVTSVLTLLQGTDGYITQYHDYLIKDVVTGNILETINATKHGIAVVDEAAAKQKFDNYK